MVLTSTAYFVTGNEIPRVSDSWKDNFPMAFLLTAPVIATTGDES